MVLVAFLHVFICVLDRVIFIRSSRNNLVFDKIYYHKATGSKIEQTIIDNMPEIDENLIEIVYIQKEEKNLPLICKYILQICTLFFSHIFIFYYLPLEGNYNLRSSIFSDPKSPEQFNEFSENGYLIGFYIIYCVYLYFSALQIKNGLLDMKQKSLLMRNDNSIYSIMFKTYKAIPFLYELKLTIDWTCTPTALDIYKWLKFQSVYDNLFLTICFMKKMYNRPIGGKVSIVEKLLMGMSSFVVLLAIILAPLLIFSSLNPTNSINNVTGAYVEVIYFSKIV